MDNAFDQLEDRVRKAAATIRRLQEENETLRAEVVELEQKTKADKGKKPSAESNRKLALLEERLAGLETERDEIRSRLLRLVELLESLE